MKSNVDEAAQLIDRTSEITLVIVTSLQGKTDEDIPDSAKKNIERLSQ